MGVSWFRSVFRSGSNSTSKGGDGVSGITSTPVLDPFLMSYATFQVPLVIK